MHTSTWPRKAASWRATHPVEAFLSWTSAPPFSISSLTASTWPLLAANWTYEREKGREGEGGGGRGREKGREGEGGREGGEGGGGRQREGEREGGRERGGKERDELKVSELEGLVGRMSA